jgi:hypothetical protein
VDRVHHLFIPEDLNQDPQIYDSQNAAKRYEKYCLPVQISQIVDVFPLKSEAREYLKDPSEYVSKYIESRRCGDFIIPVGKVLLYKILLGHAQVKVLIYIRLFDFPIHSTLNH